MGHLKPSEKPPHAMAYKNHVLEVLIFIFWVYLLDGALQIFA